MLLLLGLIALAVVLWTRASGWEPSRSEFPTQGALIGAQDGPVDFNALRATGADFAYIEASEGAQGRDEAFPRNIAAVSDAQLPYGVVHAYDPCVPAERQAANFVTIVPRDSGMLPPAIALSKLASDCGDPIVEAALESELTTFINQVEGHVGQSVVLKISPEFEAEYGIGLRIERNLWLERDFVQPDYGGRPWTLWSATSFLRREAGNAAVRWVVVQP